MCIPNSHFEGQVEQNCIGIKRNCDIILLASGFFFKKIKGVLDNNNNNKKHLNEEDEAVLTKGYC